MEYQYHPSRFRCLPDGRKVGTIRVGDILYIQDAVRPFSFPSYTTRREPWRVEAWIPREAIGRDFGTRKYKTLRCAGGHLALVRSLRDSRRVAEVADWVLLACADAALTWEFAPKTARGIGRMQGANKTRHISRRSLSQHPPQ